MITADYDGLFRQSHEGAESLMIHAISSIDKLYEEQGYAKNHPDLVVAFMQVAVKDFTAAVQGKAIQKSLLLGSRVF